VRRRGFTLFEVIVALALIISLLGAAWSFFFHLLGARDQAMRIGRQQLAVTTLIERLETDLATSLVGDRRSGAGVRGDERSVSVLTRSVPASFAERGPDDPAVFADLERAEYRFVEGAGQVRASRRVATAAGGRGSSAELGGPIHLVRFRYHDGSAWRDRFDSLQADRLPVAVEVAVWFEPWEEPETDPAIDETDDPLDETGLPPFDDELDAGFDMADPSERDMPPPDRVRVIPIPDAEPAPDDEATVGTPEVEP
jgi:prepilin-type N-terminal cleavage/methylation domain-containing protein